MKKKFQAPPCDYFRVEVPRMGCIVVNSWSAFNRQYRRLIRDPRVKQVVVEFFHHTCREDFVVDENGEEHRELSAGRTTTYVVAKRDGRLVTDASAIFPTRTLAVYLQQQVDGGAGQVRPRVMKWTRFDGSTGIVLGPNVPYAQNFPQLVAMPPEWDVEETEVLPLPWRWR